MRSPTLGAVVLCALIRPVGESAAETINKPVAAGQRTIKVINSLDYPPAFATTAATLDPEKVAETAWNGWMKHRGIPWGTLPNGTPSIRLSFDCRALPWPTIKQHSVDGPDNNMRSLAAYSALHDMFGQEKTSDRYELGHIGYLLSCTDPSCGLPYSPDSMQRQCAVGHGEYVKNLILMHRYGAGDRYLKLANRAIQSLRQSARIEDREGVGTIAWYPYGMFSPGSTLPETSDPALGGWQHLAVGWNCWAFAEWYRETGDKSDLEFAVALARRLIHSEFPDGVDGSFREDGSFGSPSKEHVASCHMHGHTHGLPGLVVLGEQLIAAGRSEEGVMFIQQAARSLDWLYDPEKNPDAGSATGWLGEWLAVAGKSEKQTDCEGCTMGDIVQTAVGLGATSRFDDKLLDYVRFYDRAEEVFRGQCIEQIFTLRDDYKSALRHCLRAKLAKESRPTTTAAELAEPAKEPVIDEAELERRYQSAIETAERMVGQQLGICGFADWVNVLPSDLDAELPGIHMQGCCADATVRAAHAIWKETVTGDVDSIRVNMAFNRRTPWAEVVSCLPHRGEINVFVKDTKQVLVRVPGWADQKQVKVYVDKQPIQVNWRGAYVVCDAVKSGQHVTVTFPLRVTEIREAPGGLSGVVYTEKWRGPAIVDIHPRGKWIPLFYRPELDSEQIP